MSVTKKKEIYEDYARKTHEELGSTKKEEIYEKSAQKSHENFEEKDVVFERVNGDIQEKILEYADQVPAIIQDSMGKPSLAYANSLNMRYPAFLFAKIHNKTIGLITLNLENQNSIHNRLYISHISAINEEILGLVARSLINYI